MRPTPTLPRFGRAAGHVVFRSRDVAVPVAIVVLAICSRRGDFLVPAALDPWFDVLGLALVIAGLAIRSLVLGTSGIRRSGVHRRVVAETLHEAGPYAWCRNPLYVGNVIILLGLALVFDSRWMLAIALPLALLAIRTLVLAEERMLRDGFGERYRAYCRRVPRFVPRRPSDSGWQRRLDWRRALRKEHGTIFAAVTAAATFALAEDHARGTVGPIDAHTGLVLAVWSVIAVLWGIVRALKRRGRLSDLYAETTAASSTDSSLSDAAA